MSNFTDEPAQQQRLPGMIWLTGGTALCYLAAALVADVFAYPGSVTAIWPASGIAVFTVIAFGYRALPGVLLGVYLNQMSWLLRTLAQDNTLPVWDSFVEHSLIGLSYAVGNLLEAALILWLVRRYTGAGNPLDGVARVVRFIVFAGLTGPVIGSLAGTLVTCGLWEWTPWSAFWSTLWTWWVSASAGILVVAPPLLFLHYEPHLPWQGTRARWVENALLVAGCSAVILIAFYWRFPFEYLLLPLLLWSAFRLGPASTSWLCGAVMLAAATASTHGYGPFAADVSRLNGTIQSLTLLQCFMTTLIATAMIVAAVVAEQRRTSSSLQVANQSLEARVATRTRELNVAREAAVQANLAKSRFMTYMCHELRTPLNTILGYCRRAMHQLSGSGDTTGELDIVNRNGDHLLRIIQDVLHMARIDAGERPPQLAPFNMTELLRDVRDAVGLQADEKRIELLMDIDRAVSDVLISDVQRLHHILVNLLSNAIKFTHQGRVCLTVNDVLHATDTCAGNGGSLPGVRHGVRFCITDTGIGIDERAIDSIFEPFEQVHAAGDGKHGSGLGLSIAQQYARSLNGPISVRSTPGEGSTFTFTVQCRASTRPVAAQAERYTPTAQTIIEHTASPKALTKPDTDRLHRLLIQRDRSWRQALSLAVCSGDARATLDLLTCPDSSPDPLESWLADCARQYRLDEVVQLLKRDETDADAHTLTLQASTFDKA